MLDQSNLEKHGLAVLFNDLDGKDFVVPSLKSIHPGWVVEKHPQYEELAQDLKDWSNSWWEDTRIRSMLETLDPASWTALSYPNVSYEKLFCIGKCLAWIFVWDDHIDDGKFTHDLDGSLEYQEQTLHFIEQCFDLTEETIPLTHLDPAIEAIKDFAIEIRATSHPSKKFLPKTYVTSKRFLEELRCWIISTVESQREREKPEIPQLDSYLRRRSLNVGFYPYVTLIEYAHGIIIPDKWWKTNEHMDIIWYESSVIAFITNDMVSLAKEIIAGQFESWIPLRMYHNGLSVQDAMNSAGQLVRTASARIIEAEERLYKDIDQEHLLALKTFIQGIKHIDVCVLEHPYSSKRYIEHGVVQEDGSIRFKMQIG